MWGCSPREEHLASWEPAIPCVLHVTGPKPLLMTRLDNGERPTKRERRSCRRCLVIMRLALVSPPCNKKEKKTSWTATGILVRPPNCSVIHSCTWKHLQSFINICSSTNSPILCSELRFTSLFYLFHSCVYADFVLFPSPPSHFSGGCLVADSCVLPYQIVPSYNLPPCAQGNPP